MHGKVQYEGHLSDQFPIIKAVKRGCMLAPTLSFTYSSFDFGLACLNLDKHRGVAILSHDNGDFFSLPQDTKQDLESSQ